MNVVGHGRAIMEEHYLKENRMDDVENIFQMNERRTSPMPTYPVFQERNQYVIQYLVDVFIYLFLFGVSVPRMHSQINGRDVDSIRKQEAARRLELSPYVIWGPQHPS